MQPARGLALGEAVQQLQARVLVPQAEERQLRGQGQAEDARDEEAEARVPAGEGPHADRLALGEAGDAAFSEAQDLRLEGLVHVAGQVAGQRVRDLVQGGVPDLPVGQLAGLDRVLRVFPAPHDDRLHSGLAESGDHSPALHRPAVLETGGPGDGVACDFGDDAESGPDLHFPEQAFVLFLLQLDVKSDAWEGYEVLDKDHREGCGLEAAQSGFFLFCFFFFPCFDFFGEPFVNYALEHVGWRQDRRRAEPDAADGALSEPGQAVLDAGLAVGVPADG